MPDFLRDLHNKVFNIDNSLKQWKKEKSIDLIREFNNIIKNNTTLETETLLNNAASKTKILSLFANKDYDSNDHVKINIFKLATIVLGPKCDDFIEQRTYSDPHNSNNELTRIIFKKSITEANLMEQTNMYMFIRLLHHFDVISDRNFLKMNEEGCLMLDNNLISDRKTIRGIIKYMTNQPEEWQHFQCADQPKSNLDLINSKKYFDNKHTAATIALSLCLALTLALILSSVFIGVIMGNIIIAAAVGAVGAVTMAGAVFAGYKERKITDLKNITKIIKKQLYENMVDDREVILQEFKNTDPPEVFTMFLEEDELNKNLNASEQNVQHNTEERSENNQKEEDKSNKNLNASEQNVQHNTKERSENNKKEEDKSDVAMANVSNSIKATDKEKLINEKTISTRL